MRGARSTCAPFAGRGGRARRARPAPRVPSGAPPAPTCPSLPARRRRQHRPDPFCRAGSLSAVGGRAGALSRRQGKPHVKRSGGARRLQQGRQAEGRGRGEEAGGRDAPGAAPARSRPGPGPAGGAEPRQRPLRGAVSTDGRRAHRSSRAPLCPACGLFSKASCAHPGRRCSLLVLLRDRK